MTTAPANGTRTFDGVAYPDCAASSPTALGWMQGAPPPLARQIRFEDDRFLNFPEIRWTLSHLRELMPTVNVPRGDAPASDLGPVDPATQQAIDALTFTDLNGVHRSWASSLPATYTDGIVVLHRGRRVYEQYAGALQPSGAHACFSVTKSYAATLAATLVHEGVLDDQQTVPHYLPEMAHTAYADATLRQVLDMQVGVAFSEAYDDRSAPFWDYARAGGFVPRPPGYSGPATFHDYLRTLKKSGAHGQAFAYKTVNTEVLCWLMQRVTGEPLASALSRRLWSPLGCEQDACLTVDASGTAFGGAGLSASLRDVARFGELMRCGGARGSQQVLLEAVVADIARGADPARFTAAGYTLLPGYSYRNMWWVAPAATGVFEARGIHGQRLSVSPRQEWVVARFASHPIAASAANDPITLPAFAALGAFLSRQ